MSSETVSSADKSNSSVAPGFAMTGIPVHVEGPPPHPAGLPAKLRAGIERLSGFAMDDVRVHRDSSEPARLGALAFARGSDIHLGPGQERHLPHEAWHVVQQKQGRVTAALNEDPALEAEADRMGAGFPGTGAPAVALRRAPARAGTVQRKVSRGGTPLAKSEPMSAVLGQYVQSDVEYILGTDSAADLRMLPVHLFDTRIKYLLGEQHDPIGNLTDTAKWHEDTRQWPTIPKMLEEVKGIPREKDDTAGTFNDVTQPFALESRHAYLLDELIDVHEYSNKLNDEFAANVTRQDVVLVQLYADAIHQSLGEVEKSTTAYDRFATQFDPKRHGASARLTAIKAFASNLSVAWIAGLESMMTAAERFSQFLGAAYARNVFNLEGDELKAARFYVAEIGKGKAAISALSGELIGLVGFPKSEDSQAVRAFAASSQSNLPTKVDHALDMGRERGMVANIDGVGAPLLVRIGNDHVRRVANAAKPPGQAIDMTDSLARFTGRTSFIEKK